MTNAKKKAAPSNPVGRPSELAETLIKAKEYLMGGYEEVGEVIPSIAGLACYCGKARITLRDYAAQDKEFSTTYEGILCLQESKAINNGLTGIFNPTIAKLVLSNHGWDKKESGELEKLQIEKLKRELQIDEEKQQPAQVIIGVEDASKA